MRQGIILTLVQILMVLSIAGKYTYQRMTLPKAWARVQPVDPYMPVRGRYVQFRVVLEPSEQGNMSAVDLSVSAGKLVATSSEFGLAVFKDPQGLTVLAEPLAFFLPENVADPSLRAPGEELWAEVSVPEKGVPRPIRLGIRKSGTLEPMELQ